MKEYKELRIAIIGCGMISHRHMTVIENLNKRGYNLRVVAAAEIDKEKLEKWGKQYGVAEENLYQDFRGVPQDEAVRKLAEAGATGPAFAALQGMYGFVQFRKDCKAELEGLKEIMPYCFHMHGKCHYVSEDLKEASIPYNEIMPVIQNSDFDGYIVTEYEDHNSGNAEIMTRRHVAMMKKLLGR